jgi:hypothetical protein
MTRKG